MDRPRLTLRDQLERGVVRLAGALPASVQRLLGGAPTRVDGLELHPEVQLALRLLNLSGQAKFERLPLPQARAQIVHEARLFGGDPVPVGRVSELSIPGDAGPIPARLYQPSGVTRPTALLIYFHGGGWVLGSLDSCDATCRFLAAQAEVAVLSVDYRLAPEHPFPAAVDDALAAFGYAIDHAESLGIDPEAIGVGGDSAGGNLATVVSQLATADDGPAPVFQLLFYPATDLTSRRPSRKLFAEGFFLTEDQLDWYRNHYLPDEADWQDPMASPLLAEDLAGLPPAYIAVAGFDPLRDEGEEYADRLREAGVPVTLRRHSGLIHGFVNAIGVGRTGRDALLEAASALRVGLSFTAAARSANAGPEPAATNRL